MDPSRSLKLTPREFYLLIEVASEKRYDLLELESIKTLMMRVAYHVDPKKKLKPKDLFDRSKMKKEKNTDVEKAIEKAKNQQEWLNQVKFTPKEGV